MILLFDCALRLVSLFIGCTVLRMKFLKYLFLSDILNCQVSACVSKLLDFDLPK